MSISLEQRSSRGVDHQRLFASSYRPDIDGLRGLAIIAVVAFHAFPTILSGGFVGVDVFFVISGFLISRIIFNELTSGTFDLGIFFARRIRRIFPALLLVLSATLLAGWFLLLPDEYKKLGRQVWGGAGFVSNFFLWKDTGYFDSAANLKPLLHLWSLGIEEQFYIVWPLLIWATSRTRASLRIVIFTILIISFSMNILETPIDSVAAFYSPATRVWELLAGASLAWASVKTDSRLTSALANPRFSFNVQSSFENSLESTFGVVLIVMTALWVTAENAFPGWWAVLPVAGAVLIINAGSDAWVNKRILSSRPMVWVGLISFPLYLWHWPLFTFVRIVNSREPAAEVKVALICVSVVFAWLTYKLVELPIRSLSIRITRTAGLTILMIVAGFSGFLIYSNDGLAHREIALKQKSNDFQFPPLFRNKCLLTESPDSGDWCNDGNIQGDPEVALLGDSYATSYSQLLLNLTKSWSFSFKQFGRGQCPPLLDFGPRVCSEAAAHYLNFSVHSPSVKKIILAGAWPSYVNGKTYDWLTPPQPTSSGDFKTSFRKTLEFLQGHNKNVIVFLAPPSGSRPKSCAIRPFGPTTRDYCALPLSVALHLDHGSRKIVQDLVAEFPLVRVFDPYPYLCDGALCTVMDGEKVLFIDADHMSAFGGEFLAARAQLQLKTLLLAR
ncbi:MAG: acyltransferase family protein [Rhodoferax sp.]|nr:acyltransferase family protein [Rhodoferax sp.]